MGVLRLPVSPLSRRRHSFSSASAPIQERGIWPIVRLRRSRVPGQSRGAIVSSRAQPAWTWIRVWIVVTLREWLAGSPKKNWVMVSPAATRPVTTQWATVQE